MSKLSKEEFLECINKLKDRKQKVVDKICHSIFDLCSYTPVDLKELKQDMGQIGDFIDSTKKLVPDEFKPCFMDYLEIALESLITISAYIENTLDENRPVFSVSMHNDHKVAYILKNNIDFRKAMKDVFLELKNKTPKER